MDRHEYDLVLGRLAVHFKVLTKDKVAEALQRRRLTDETQGLANFLVDEGYIAPDVLEKLERARAQYLQKNGLQPPEEPPDDSTQPVEPLEPAPPEISPPLADIEPVAPEPGAPQLDATQPFAPQAEAEQWSASDWGASEGQAPAGGAPPVGPPMGMPPAEGPPMVGPPFADAQFAAPPFAGPPTGGPPPPGPPPPGPPPPGPPPSGMPFISPPSAGPPMGGPPIGEAGSIHDRLVHAAPSGSSYPIQFSDDTTLDELLTEVQRTRGSDLHIHSKAGLRVRLHGRMATTSDILSPERCKELVFSILDEDQSRQLEERLQLDFAYEIPGVGRFRANAYKQQNGFDAVFRAIPPNPPTLAELGLPEELERIVSFHQGMVLFTGPAGCGKSSTMAAMVRLLNAKRPDHILTVEDPIEYVHVSDNCLINQREVGPHTESFARALRAALREDPDIIAIGELRDLETIELALTAAETGHLVLGTLHTSSAIRTINRLLGVFPPEQQNQIRTMVSESLRAVISQRLIPRADGQGRVAAIEVLMSNRAIGNLIRENKTFQIPSQMQTGSAQGMVMLDNSLTKLLQDGLITAEEAKRNAEDPKRFA